ncbi:MAG: hypothetical protein AUJ12_05930 [Alphaproteobacteria bacterium CG1_02_46_17]|nr:MAG: hypothetical protein AUJ12_05930 [Alphaproteobacteria bacterium CG1_02_46_17]
MMHSPSSSRKFELKLPLTGLILLSGLLILPISGSFAEESVATPQTGTTHTLPIMPSKITPLHDNKDNEGLSKAAPDIQTIKSSENLAALEKLTLAPDSDDFSAGEDWKNLSRKSLLQKLSALSAQDQKSEDRHLNINRLVSVTADEGDYPTVSKEFPLDMYSLRLTKLLEYGSMDQLLKLYTANQDSPPTSEAAEAGVTAMLWAQESGLACLEQKALPENIRSSNNALWDKVDLFCKGLLGPASGQDETQKFINASRIYVTATELAPPESIEDLNKTDQISIIALASIGKLPPPLKDKEELKKINDLPLALLLKLGPQEGEIRDNLIAQARDRAMISPESKEIEQPETPVLPDKEDDTDTIEEDKKEPEQPSQPSESDSEGETSETLEPENE